MAEFTILLAIIYFYWRKNYFIGEKLQLIGENQILLANWKFQAFFSSFPSQATKIKPPASAEGF
ncbi:hypothetical protein DYI25_19795 [Mesobacillus boroniphilus]|uniref:Uncharacterized protein n=1 Tax=Mesobacillus boroniphilus TaxID=308892 RepID=A0A944CQ97_9BACI|nr:hypothetical protein [Mesobacillus boroniphilus]